MAEPIRELGLPALRGGSVLTVGTFDGIHRGHADLIARVAGRARAAGLPSIVVTFEPHPLEIVNPSAAPLLLTPGEEKIEALADTAIDYVAVVPFSAALAAYPAAMFVRRVLRERFAMRELFIGYDHGLGRGREGDANALRALGERDGFPVEVVRAVVLDDGAPVSSSAIRAGLVAGAVETVVGALGRRYSVRGRVVPGDQRGRALGYPTLNIAVPSARKLLPAAGVYAVSVQSPRGTFGGMMNLGSRPTFDDAALSLEVHLFGASGDWYGTDVRIEFVRRLRDVVRFPGVDALVAQLGRDAEAAQLALTEVKTGLNLNGSA